MANSMAVIPDNEIIVEGGGLVPSTQGASSGDVLTVGQNGPEWATPGGGGGGVPDVADPLYVDTDDAVALRYGSGLYLEDGENYNDTLAVALSGTGGLYYDGNALAVQVDPAGGLENFIDDGVQIGLRAKVDGTTIGVTASGELEALGGLPDTTGASSGDVLTVGQDGPEWATPGGGGGGMTQLLTPAQTASLIEVRGLPNNLQWTAGYYGDPMATFTRGNGVRRLFICVELDSSDFSYSVTYYNMSVGLKLRNSGSDVAPLSLAHIKDEIYQVNASENTMIICKEIPLYIPEAFNHNGTVVAVDDVAINSVSIDFDSTGSQPSSLAASSLSVWII